MQCVFSFCWIRIDPIEMFLFELLYYSLFLSHVVSYIFIYVMSFVSHFQNLLPHVKTTKRLNSAKQELIFLLFSWNANLILCFFSSVDSCFLFLLPSSSDFKKNYLCILINFLAKTTTEFLRLSDWFRRRSFSFLYIDQFSFSFTKGTLE